MKLDLKYNQKPEDLNFIDCVYTPLTEAEATYYLREGWKQLFGAYPNLNSLAILWAQFCLETGHGASLRNYNYGNIKKNLEYSQFYTSYEAGEFINGKHEMFYPYHPQTLFAAWKTPLEGAQGYLNFLSKRKRYTKAWDELVAGNTINYVKELRVGGYFTAPLEKYTNIVVKLVNDFNSKSSSLLAFTPTPSIPPFLVEEQEEQKSKPELKPEKKPEIEKETSKPPEEKPENVQDDIEKSDELNSTFDIINLIYQIFLRLWEAIKNIFLKK